MSRIDAIKGFLEDDPKDSFSRYALALEYVKLDRWDDAIQEFEIVISNDAEYVATYYQLAKAYEHQEQRDKAESTYRTGMEVGVHAKDMHTVGELQEALNALLVS
jgi:Tfp pilus assembly protein PilF